MRLRRPHPHKLQILRRCVQLATVLLMLFIPTSARYSNYLAARQLDRNLSAWEGTPQGRTLGAVDAFYRALPGGVTERAGHPVRDRDRVLRRAQELRGGPWSIALGPVSLTDPLAAAESVAASHRTSRVLWLGLLLPVLAALLLGRVFCSWVCPMNLLLEISDKARGLLRFLELRPHDLHFSRGTKYVLLAVGVAMAALLAVPVLGYVYPPAVLGREAHALIAAFFDRAEAGRFGLSLQGLTWLSLLILSVVLFEVFVSRRWWCRYICPGGALYSLLGRFRLVRVRLDVAGCTRCADCVPVCQMGLNPMLASPGGECDNCGLCISHCAPGVLRYEMRSLRGGSLRRRPQGHGSDGAEGGPGEARPARSRPAGAAGVALILAAGLTGSLLAPPAAWGHHILGIPHYAYDEQYPQVPILTYRVDLGSYEVKMTGYPGMPEPGEQVELHVYLRSLIDGRPFDGTMTCEVLEQRLLADDRRVYGPVTAGLEESLYKFFPRFPEEANYRVRIRYEADGAPWIVELPMVVGEPGSPWKVLIAAGIVLLLFLVVIRALRIKLRRARAAVSRTAISRTPSPPAHGAASWRGRPVHR